MSCISCNTPTKKYKCPKCLEPYCSLDCYKQHTQAAQCESHGSTPSTLDIPLSTPELEPTVHEPFTTEDTVPRNKLEQLRHSDTLKELLYNPHLRNLLREIDVAPNAWKAVRAAMQEPLFMEFADACLKVVEPPSTEELHEAQLLS